MTPFVERGLGLLQVERVEALGDLTKDPDEKIAGFNKLP
jgi:hypothetical protein